MTTIKTSITLQRFELSIHLGWPDAERLTKQWVWLDIALFFPKPPDACLTDNLDDTFSYETLCHLIQEKISEKPYRLIEHLGFEIYTLVKKTLPKDLRIEICVTKKPPIQHLTGGVSFRYGDER